MSLVPPRDLALRIGAHAGGAPSAHETLAERLRMVLETQPRQIPWRPEFGCDLDGLVGTPMTPSWLSDAEARIRAAIQRWVPGVRVRKCEVRPMMSLGARMDGRHRSLPTAEASIVPFGADASLEVQLDLDTPDGALTLQLDIPA